MMHLNSIEERLRVLSSEFWPELQFLAQLLPDLAELIMLTSF